MIDSAVVSCPAMNTVMASSRSSSSEKAAPASSRAPEPSSRSCGYRMGGAGAALLNDLEENGVDVGDSGLCVASGIDGHRLGYEPTERAQLEHERSHHPFEGVAHRAAGMATSVQTSTMHDVEMMAEAICQRSTAPLGAVPAPWRRRWLALWLRSERGHVAGSWVRCGVGWCAAGLSEVSSPSPRRGSRRVMMSFQAVWFQSSPDVH